MKPIEWTIRKAAFEFGVNHTTLTKGLIREGHEIVHVGRGKRGQTFKTRDIVAALFGDEERARTRDLEASARLKEQKHDRLSGRLIEWDEAEARITRILQPIRTAIVNARATLPARVNPSDPHLAREAIESWESSVMALLREEAVKAATEDLEPKNEDEAEDEET